MMWASEVRMLSGKLIHLIEQNWDEIARRVIEQVRSDSEFAHLRALPEIELREWGQNILHNLDHWLSAGNETELARHYEELGRVRFTEQVPLHEAVRGLCTLREKMTDYVQENFYAKNSLEFCAEEELERRLSRFFDLLLCNMVRGYERALRLAAHVEAA
jgi:hypothetical protein